MKLNELHHQAIKLRQGEEVDTISKTELNAALHSEDTPRALAAARLTRLYAENGSISIVRKIERFESLYSQMPTIGKANLIDAIIQTTDSDSELLLQYTDLFLRGLDDESPAVRRKASLALLITAQRAPGSLVDAVADLVVGVDDQSPPVITNTLQGVARVLDHLNSTGAEITSTHTLVRQGLIDLALASLESANLELRMGSIDYLANVAEATPELVAEHTEQIGTRLQDPDERIRAKSAYALTNVADVDPDKPRPHLSQMAALLQDPNEVARLNATTVLLTCAEQSNLDLPTEDIAEALPTLLSTEIVAVQTNAIYLSYILISEDPTAISREGKVLSLLNNLQSDRAIEVDDTIFDQITSALNQPAIDGSSSSASSSAPSTNEQLADQSSSSNQEQDHETAEHTGIFSGTEGADCPVCGATIDSFQASFCPDCGTEL